MNGLHAAIIMDGNGRWARTRGKPRWRGHMAGADSVREVLRACPDLGIGTLTLYAFSTDNWKRPAAEVGRLFWLLREHSRRERDELIESGVRVTAIGRRDRIPRGALGELETTERLTAHCSRVHLRLAIDYGARAAIAEAARRLAIELRDGLRDAESIDRDALGSMIQGDVPDVDLLIRTAGEQRLSDFMLWETAYAELYFTPVLWPDFRRPDLEKAVAEFRRRERKFGGLAVVNGRKVESPEAVTAGR